MPITLDESMMGLRMFEKGGKGKLNKVLASLRAVSQNLLVNQLLE